MRNIKEEIEINGLKPFYLLAGENDYLRRSQKAVLLKALTQDQGQGQEREVEVLSGEASLDALVQSASMVSLFGSAKIIVQENPAWLSKKVDTEELCQWIEAPLEGVSIVLVSPKKIDKRKKFSKYLIKKNMLVAADPLKPWELANFVRARARALGKHMDQETAQALVALVGEEEVLLDNELKKMVLYVQDKKTLDLEDVEALVSRSAQAGIFDFMDALSDQDGVKSLRLLDQLLLGGEPAVKILFMIARQFRILLQGRQLMDRGQTYGQIVKAMGVNPYVWKKAQPFCQRFDEARLKKTFYQVQKIDRRLKTGEGQPRQLLEQFILDFCLT